MKRLLIVLATLTIVALGAAPSQAAPSQAAPHKPDLTRWHTYTDAGHPGRVVTGTGKVFQGFNIVSERVQPVGPTITLSPDGTSTVTGWRRLGYVEDQATWTGSGDGWYYVLDLRASVGQQQIDGHYDWPGPYQYRQAPACMRHKPGSTTNSATYCNFRWNFSALEAKGCGANESCTIDLPWGSRDFSANNVTSVLFEGLWHNAANAGLATGASLMSYTGDAQARFTVPNHLTRIYCTGSFWVTIDYGDNVGRIGSDYCTGLTAIS